MKKTNNKKKTSEDIHIVTRGVRINTPGVQVELQSNDSRETLKDIKKMAEEIIDKYGKDKRECEHR
jgi:hypothetical protein